MLLESSTPMTKYLEIISQFAKRLNHSACDYIMIRDGHHPTKQASTHQCTRCCFSKVHDFPTAELGLKLGGFMFLGGKPKRSSRYVGDLD